MPVKTTPYASCLEPECDWETTASDADRAAEKHTKTTRHGTRAGQRPKETS